MAATKSAGQKGRTQTDPGADLPDPDVIAAGAVVLRKGAVLLVHRPKYDDWSFPKGKQDPGEHEAVTAVREVLEETGVRIRLGVPLTAVAYIQSGGGVKLVHYWVGKAVDGADVSAYQPNNEIDQVRWVPFEEARSLLSYDYDRQLFKEAVARPEHTAPLIVLRHAKARSRRHWSEDDRSRPLTPTGEAQARRLVSLLSAYDPRRVVTSSSTRCANTVWPYAVSAGLKVHATPALSEESYTPKQIGRLLTDLMERRRPSLVCSHRPVLPIVLEQLGIDIEPLKPAEMVILHHREGQPRALERHYPC